MWGAGKSEDVSPATGGTARPWPFGTSRPSPTPCTTASLQAHMVSLGFEPPGQGGGIFLLFPQA